MTKKRPGAEGAPLLDVDLDRVRKQQARAITGGGAYQSWTRILDALEIAKLGQEAAAELQATEDAEREGHAARMDRAIEPRVVSHG